MQIRDVKSKLLLKKEVNMLLIIDHGNGHNLFQWIIDHHIITTPLD